MQLTGAIRVSRRETYPIKERELIKGSRDQIGYSMIIINLIEGQQGRGTFVDRTREGLARVKTALNKSIRSLPNTLRK